MFNEEELPVGSSSEEFFSKPNFDEAATHGEAAFGKVRGERFYIIPMPPPISGAAAGVFSGMSTTSAPIVMAVPAIETAF